MRSYIEVVAGRFPYQELNALFTSDIAHYRFLERQEQEKSAPHQSRLSA
jgi:hypothetical protein